MVKKSKQKKELSSCDKIYFLAFCIALFVFLYFRLSSGLMRGANPDEYSHYHFTYLITKGLIPYKDFFMLYSPVFHLVLSFIFKIIGESYLALTMSRFLIFLLFVITLFLFYKIARLFVGKKLSFLSTLILASYPLPFEKAIETRPDNLMIPVYLGGVYLSLRGLNSRRKTDFILGGALLALSIIVMIKIAIVVGSFLVGFIIVLFFKERKKSKVVNVGLDFAKGAGVVFFLFFFILFSFGIAKPAIFSMFRYSVAIASTLRFGTELHPYFWFYPHDYVYGIYKGISWYVSSAIVILAVAGFIITVIKGIIFGRSIERLLLAILLLMSFVSVFMVLRPYQQYLLPFCTLVPIFTIFAVEDIFRIIERIKPSINIVGFLFIVIFLTLSMWEKWKVNRYRQDDYTKQFIEYVLVNTNKDDVFWGGVGEYIFRLDGYDVSHLSYFEFPTSVTAKLPSLIPTLEKRNTKYLSAPTKSIYDKAWPFSSYKARQFAEWVEENFTLTDYPNLWVRKEEI